MRRHAARPALQQQGALLHQRVVVQVGPRRKEQHVWQQLVDADALALY
jgi:hypothetical protein